MYIEEQNRRTELIKFSGAISETCEELREDRYMEKRQKHRLPMSLLKSPTKAIAAVAGCGRARAHRRSPCPGAPEDVLHLILDNLPNPFDRLNFGAACRSWRSAATARHAPRHPPLPLLASYGSGNRRLHVLDPYNDGHYVHRLRVPRMGSGARCCGSGNGWLATSRLDPSRHVLLVNPMSGAKVRLPREKTIAYPKYCRAVKPWVEQYIKKVVWLASSPASSDLLVACVTNLCTLSVCMGGGAGKWTAWGTEMRMEDIIFYRGKLWGVTSSPAAILSFEIGFGGERRAPVIMLSSLLALEGGHGELGDLRRTYDFCHCYLAERRGELLLVIRFGQREAAARTTHGFRVFELRLQADAAEAVQIGSLGGDCVLFVGASGSKSLAGVRPGGSARADCIYFTDDDFGIDFGGSVLGTDTERWASNVSAAMQERRSSRDFGIYRMGDGSIQRFLPSKCVDGLYPPTWFFLPANSTVLHDS